MDGPLEASKSAGAKGFAGSQTDCTRANAFPVVSRLHVFKVHIF